MEAIRRAECYIVVDYANAPTAEVLAPLLTRLNCHVVALNAAVDEMKMSISAQEFQNSLRQLAKICEVLRPAIGVRLDVGGERVFVVDDQGNIVPGDLLCAAMTIMALKAKGGGTIAVPVSMPNVFEIIAERYNGSIVRTGMNPQSRMAACNREDVIMGGDEHGSFIWPEFQPVVDGLMTVAKLLEFLTTQNTTLWQATAEVPAYHTVHGDVSCPWERKGTVMRLLNQQYKERLDKQIDGVKIRLSDDEWVLVAPDPDRPRFFVHAESRSFEEAQDLVTKYERIVEGLQ